jgi:hypothetical protein
MPADEFLDLSARQITAMGGIWSVKVSPAVPREVRI